MNTVCNDLPSKADFGRNGFGAVAQNDNKVIEEAAQVLEKAAQHLRATASQSMDREMGNRSLLGRARAIYAARRNRAKILGDRNIADGPAWDILLDLLISEASGRAVAVSEAALAAGCPPTTGLRWVQVLHDVGFIEKVDDLHDCRRKFIRLSEKGREMTARCIEEAPIALDSSGW